MGTLWSKHGVLVETDSHAALIECAVCPCGCSNTMNAQPEGVLNAACTTCSDWNVLSDDVPSIFIMEPNCEFYLSVLGPTPCNTAGWNRTWTIWVTKNFPIAGLWDVWVIFTYFDSLGTPRVVRFYKLYLEDPLCRAWVAESVPFFDWSEPDADCDWTGASILLTAVP